MAGGLWQERDGVSNLGSLDGRALCAHFHAFLAERSYGRRWDQLFVSVDVSYLWTGC